MYSWTLNLHVDTASVEESLGHSSLTLAPPQCGSAEGPGPVGGWCYPCLCDLFVVGVC